MLCMQLIKLYSFAITYVQQLFGGQVEKSTFFHLRKALSVLFAQYLYAA